MTLLRSLDKALVKIETVFLVLFLTVEKKEQVGIPGGLPRSPMGHLSPETRVHTFDEVERGLTYEGAIRDEERCLRCYRVALFATKA